MRCPLPRSCALAELSQPSGDIDAHHTYVPIELVRGDAFYWQSLVAAAVIVAIPVAIVYSLFLDRLVSGFTMGAVKG